MSSEKARASHLLIKHQGSRRPESWRDPDGARIKNTTKESAISQLRGLREEIVSGRSSFGDLASQYSDCNSAKRLGDLGSFTRGRMQKPFEDATFALKVGEISGIVKLTAGCTLS